MNKKQIVWAAGLLGAFALWTAAVCMVDVQTIGPRESSVGFAALNGFVHSLTGVHMVLYAVTDWLGLVPVFFGMGFGLLGLVQWIGRRSILKVDRSILVLGGFYLAVMAAYVFFEEHAVNYRPVLINGILEVSYPSSTTLLVLTVMPTAAMQLKGRIRKPAIRQIVLRMITGFSVFMLACRLVSGVHWVTDIIGGGLLSGGLVLLYAAFAEPERTLGNKVR